MKKLKSFMLAAASVAVLVAAALIAAKAARNASEREREYWSELETHVIETWSDGREHPDHQCKYDPSWCNPHYCEHLLKNRAGK